MRLAIAVLLSVLLTAGAAMGRPVVGGHAVEHAVEFAGPSRPNVLFAYWQMNDPTGFATVDLTADAVPYFHPSNHMSFDGTTHWWCGRIEYDADGGYGNRWDQRLELPAVDITGAVYPVLTFAHYYDSEVGYDFTYVQARQGGEYVSLNSGYDGLIPGGAWVDLGAYGFVLTGMDNPIQARFRFISDGAYSDEDGLYLSVGGAYHVDNIKIYDFYGGTVYFYDGVSGGSPCIASVPPAAGDYWHLVDDICSSNVIPSWWCGDDADTSLIPPNLANALISPIVSIPGGSQSCTLRYAIHAEVPTSDPGDFWDVSVSVDDGEWISLCTWFGDFGACAGWGTTGLMGQPLDRFLSPIHGVSFQVRFTFYTNDDGCGPGVAGGAGINVDDTWFEGEPEPPPWPVENVSWGSIKALYR